MTTSLESYVDGLRSALRAARENAERWMEMSPESPRDGDPAEHWISIARLRRLEVGRLEMLLAQTRDRRNSP